jgi:hypothetical protein
VWPPVFSRHADSPIGLMPDKIPPAVPTRVLKRAGNGAGGLRVDDEPHGRLPAW